MQPRITPEIMEALLRRRAGGVGGGNTTPAMGQTLQVNPLGGPTGPSQSPLPQQPQPMAAGSIPSSQGQVQPAQAQTAAGQKGAGGGDPESKNLMKALLQRLVRDL